MLFVSEAWGVICLLGKQLVPRDLPLWLRCLEMAGLTSLMDGFMLVAGCNCQVHAFQEITPQDVENSENQ